MVARGFRGDATTLERHRFGSLDVAYGVLVLVVAVAVVWGDTLLAPR